MMIPKFLYKRINGRLENKTQNTDNLYLLYNRFNLLHREEHNSRDYSTEDKSQFIKRFIERANSTNSYLAEYKTRFEKNFIRYSKRKCFKMKTHWRLVVGLGNENTLETSISLHPLYGFPYIPSSAVKGLARAAALFLENLAVSENDKKLNKNAKIDDIAKKIFGTEEEENTIKKIFGTEEAAGNTIFFDALPEKSINIFETDIMNVHYDEYYLDTENPTKPPADWYSPNPIKFVTIKPDTEFTFYIAGEDSCSAEKWLKAGLTDIGVGGKTSSGYGYFF